jgi:glycosyltransferase involved in cell wall biosynthesis
VAKFRVNLIAIGDPYDINTWSNVPYFLLQGLQSQGIDVCGINLLPETWVSYRVHRYAVKFWSRLVAATMKSHRSVSPLRNRFSHYLISRNIRTLLRLQPAADANLFLTFSFSSFRYSTTPVIHYCDNTYEQSLAEMRRSVTGRDRFFIEIEKTNIAHAALVLALNERCRVFIHDRYHCENVHRLKAGINLDLLDSDEPETLIALKASRRDILFIGRGAHMRGADILLQAFRIFNRENGGNYTLHLVGIPREELENLDDSVKIYPYLRKDDPAELKVYCDLLASARLFVFPMRGGPLPGAVREAQWACTPVIMSNVSQAGERVRHEEDGILVDSLDPQAFAFQMSRIVRDENRWREMAIQARCSVAGNTWSHTASQLLQFLKAETEPETAIHK